MFDDDLFRKEEEKIMFTSDKLNDELMLCQAGVDDIKSLFELVEDLGRPYPEHIQTINQLRRLKYLVEKVGSYSQANQKLRDIIKEEQFKNTELQARLEAQEKIIKEVQKENEKLFLEKEELKKGK